MFFFIIIYVIALLLFLFAPLPLQILFMIVNIFIPDPIPIVDEALMAASIIKKILMAEKIMEFAEDHPVLFKTIVLGFVLLIISLIILFMIYIFAKI